MPIQLLLGHIVRKVDDRGFMFIRSHGTDYFAHRSECMSDFDGMLRGDEVQFEAEEGPRGPRAVAVEKV